MIDDAAAAAGSDAPATTGGAAAGTASSSVCIELSTSFFSVRIGRGPREGEGEILADRGDRAEDGDATDDIGDTSSRGTSCVRIGCSFVLSTSDPDDGSGVCSWPKLGLDVPFSRGGATWSHTGTALRTTLGLRSTRSIRVVVEGLSDRDGVPAREDRDAGAGGAAAGEGCWSSSDTCDGDSGGEIGIVGGITGGGRGGFDAITVAPPAVILAVLIGGNPPRTEGAFVLGLGAGPVPIGDDAEDDPGTGGGGGGRGSGR